MGVGRSPSPQKHIGDTYCHVQGAGTNVILKVYILHDMHPGNMWKVGEGTKMHNNFIGCYHRVGLRSLYLRLVHCNTLYILVRFWGGLGFEYLLDENANLLDK